MEELKNIFDVIFLSDKELGIAADHSGDRPCLIVGIEPESGDGFVVPLSTQYRPGDSNRMQHQLAFGSYIDLSNTPIRITETQLRWSNKSDKWIDNEDAEVLEERFHKWINMGENYDY